MKLSKSAVETIGLGITAGMRASVNQFLMVGSLVRIPSPELDKSRFRFLQSATCAAILAAGALLELTIDKNPRTGNRTSAGGVIGRGISGAVTGALVYKKNKGSVLAGALLGSAVAIASTYLFYYLRKGVGKRTGIRDAYVGGMEDVLALGTGIASICIK